MSAGTCGRCVVEDHEHCSELVIPGHDEALTQPCGCQCGRAPAFGDLSWHRRVSWHEGRRTGRVVAVAAGDVVEVQPDGCDDDTTLWLPAGELRLTGEGDLIRLVARVLSERGS